MRKLLTLGLCLLALLPLSAFTDSFASMNSNPLYLEFFSALKDKKSEEEVLASLEAYLESAGTVSEKARAEYQVARWYSEKDKDSKAKAHFNAAKEYYYQIPEEENGILKEVAHSDILAGEYLINGGISNGLATSNAVKELYKKWPDEYVIALCEAYRYLNTPPIAGGSVTKARKILDKVGKEADGMAKPDLFSYYIARATVLTEQEDWDGSDEYIRKALELYSHDEMITDLQKKNKKGRK